MKIRTTSFISILCIGMLMTIPLCAQEYTVTLEKIAQELAKGIQENKRKAVAVVEFTDNQGTVTGLGNFLADKTLTQLLKYKNGLSVITLDRLNYLLEENKLSVQKGLVDQKTAVRLGKVTGVDALVVGKITPLRQNGEKIDLSIQVIKLETLEVIYATEGTISNTTALKELTEIKI